MKANYKTVGVDATAKLKDCTTVNEKNKLSSIAKWSQDVGKKTGKKIYHRYIHIDRKSRDQGGESVVYG